MRKSFVFILFLFLWNFGHTQELKFDVKVITQVKPLSDPLFIQSMEKTMRDFLNNTVWTDTYYEEFERIRGTMQVTIVEEAVLNSYRAEVIVKTERPVYKSNYTTQVLNIIDKQVSFTYNGLYPLQKTTNILYDPLSSLLSYYAYVAIGMDEESFKNGGGETAMKKAQEIVNAMISSGANTEGWNNIAGVRRNRYYLIENFFNPQLRQYRQAFYEYHRLGLDNMYQAAEKSRAVILSAITAIGVAAKDVPNTMIINGFSDAKTNEIIEIFLGADKGQKTKVRDIMLGVDPTKSNYYDKLAQ